MLKILLLALVSIASAAYYEDSAAYWIQRINNDPNRGFKAGYNEFFAGMSFEEISAIMGARMDKQEGKERKVPLKEVGATNLTSFTSGIDKWENCHSTIFKIKSQANCGSCWAVAASETAADRTCIANYDQMSPADNDKHPAISLSAAYLMSCCTYCGEGCNGGSPFDAMKYWQINGYVTGGAKDSYCGCQPYPCPCQKSNIKGKMYTPPCSDRCQRFYDQAYTYKDKHYATDYYRVVGEADMMKEIQERGPIECAFAVYENFFHYKSGVYNQTEGNKAGAHAIKIIGWGEENGMPYWLINNSWSHKWGMKGQFKFLRGKNLCNMEKYCVTGTAKKGDSDFKLVCKYI